MSTRRIDRLAFRIGHALADVLGLHQKAWLDRDENASRQLCRKLEELEQLSEHCDTLDIKDDLRNSTSVWEQQFNRPEHVTWWAIYRAFCDLGDTGGIGRLMVLTTRNACTALAPNAPGCDGLGKALENRLRAELQAGSPLPWRRAVDTLAQAACDHVGCSGPLQGERLKRAVTQSLFPLGGYLERPSLASFESESSPWPATGVVKNHVLVKSNITDLVRSLSWCVVGWGQELDWAAGQWFFAALHIGLVTHRPIVDGALWQQDGRVLGMLPTELPDPYSEEWEDLTGEDEKWDDEHDWGVALKGLVEDDLTQLNQSDLLPSTAQQTLEEWGHHVQQSVSEALGRDEAAEMRASGPVLRAIADSQRRTVRLEASEDGLTTDLLMSGQSGDWSVLYRIFRVLLGQLREDLSRNLPDDQIGWVQYGELDEDSPAKASEQLRRQVQRLRKLLDQEARSLLQVSHADKGRDAFRLEGRVLAERWQIEVNLPDPDS